MTNIETEKPKLTRAQQAAIKRNARAREATARELETLKKRSTRARQAELRDAGKRNIIAILRTQLGMTLREFAGVLGVRGPQEAHRVTMSISPGFKYVRSVVRYCRRRGIELDEKTLFD